MKKLICFLIFWLTLTCTYGQGWERQFALGNYNSFGTGEMIPTPDGGFLINNYFQSNPPPFDSVGNIYNCYKISADGKEQWRKTNEELFGARVVTLWPGEANTMLFVTLQNDTTRLIKTDANFQIIWSMVLDGADGQVGYKTRLKTTAGGYVLMYQKMGQQSAPMRMIKTNVNGVVLWEKNFTSSNNYYSFHDFVADKQGDLFLFGAGYSNSTNITVVSKFTAAGDAVFEQLYTQSVSTFSPVILNDNLLAFIDFQKIFFIDGNGQFLYSVNLPPNPNSVYRIVATRDGNLVMATQGTQSAMYKIKPDGTQLWHHTYGGLNAEYDKAPFSIWALPNGGIATFFIHSSGQRPHFVVRTDASGLVYTNELHGNIFADINNDCTNTPGTDFPAPAITIVAQKGSDFYYATTDTAGNYALTLDTGAYLLRLVPPGGIWHTCTDSLNLIFSAYDTLQWSTGINSMLNCPWPGVDLSAPFLRRCFPSDYHIAYGNSGNVTADSAFVTLTLDSLLTFQSASIPYVELSSHVYQFQLGNLTPLQTGSFQVTVAVDCSAPTGQTHCSSVDIGLTNECPHTADETPIIEVSAACDGDSVSFKIQNSGGAPMTNPAEFVIIEDLIIMRQGQFQLPATEFTTIKCPANGATSRIYAGQAPGEPPFFAPTAAIEGCNGAIQPGYWNMFPENIVRQSMDHDCQPNIGPYDPNDKQAVPTGYDTEHYIGRGVGLDYKIRFQNIGTDTAFTVIVRDTLSPWLDPETVRPGAASHPYTWQLLGNGVLQFRFDPIHLPDSTVNEAASHGYVTFHIDQKTNVPLQTLIENQAAIFFDFNEPIFTNTTFHRVGEKFIFLDFWEPKQASVLINAIPNPFSEETTLEVKGLVNASPLSLQVFDLQGKMVREMNTSGNTFSLIKDGLTTGIYVFNIQQNGALIGRGKLVIQE